MAESLVFAFHESTLYTFRRGDKYSASVFGGPSRAMVGGIPFGPKPLHCVGRLGSRHIPALSNHQLFDLPLIYGMYYDNCQLTYRVAYGHEVELLAIEPATSIENWPYPDFPSLLPYLPLRLDDRPSRVAYGQFAARFPNMPGMQSAEMIVAVPPPASIGLSLWGDYGDADGVTILFECDLQNRTVRASNVTS